MNQNSPAYDIAYAKPACQHLTIRPAVIAEQRGKVTGVLWMRRSFRIEMTTCVREATAAAVSTLVDMESKEACIRIGQAVYVRDHKCASTAWEEADCSTQFWTISSAADMGHR